MLNVNLEIKSYEEGERLLRAVFGVKQEPDMNTVYRHVAPSAVDLTPIETIATDKVYTKEDARKAHLDKVIAKEAEGAEAVEAYKNGVRDILKGFGVAKIPALADNQFEAFIAKIAAL